MGRSGGQYIGVVEKTKNNRFDLTLNELAYIKAFLFTDDDQCGMHVGIELRANIFALQAHDSVQSARICCVFKPKGSP